MTERIFVDTNILVYAYDLGQPEKRAVAIEWLTTTWREQTGRTSTQVLNELYVTLTRKLQRKMTGDDAWDAVHSLMAWDPQPLDRTVLSGAKEIERRYRLSWWDSLIVSAAQIQGCSTLLSEDFQHSMFFDGLTVRNPFNSSVQEVRPAYALGGLPIRHRRPGRPRKSAAA